MNGIEKISARILADAETEAAAIRAQAGEKAAQLRADYDRRIELEQQRLTAEAQAEADKQLERDQGAARMAGSCSKRSRRSSTPPSGRRSSSFSRSPRRSIRSSARSLPHGQARPAARS